MVEISSKTARKMAIEAFESSLKLAKRARLAEQKAGYYARFISDSDMPAYVRITTKLEANYDDSKWLNS